MFRGSGNDAYGHFLTAAVIYSIAYSRRCHSGGKVEKAGVLGARKPKGPVKQAKLNLNISLPLTTRRKFTDSLRILYTTF
jgi:hypothetical protein